MKFLFIVLTVCLAVLSATASKPKECYEAPFKNGNGNVACYAYFPSWSYVAETNKCQRFIYGGCGANGNRFDTKDECKETCS
ncbi:Male accessory gland serine protease inhibitor [Halotydeus destructor]|nr:Male accessory gland serine protease inhibitor [Halotydeus destructor]